MVAKQTPAFYPIVLDADVLRIYHSPIGKYIAGKTYIASVVWWLGDIDGPFVQDVVAGDACVAWGRKGEMGGQAK